MIIRFIAWPALATMIALQGCATLSETSWRLRQEDKPLAVRAAASLGETAGFVAMVPVSVVLLPLLLPVVHLLDLGDPYTVLFLPSIAGGILVSTVTGGAVDLVLAPFGGADPAPPKERTSPTLEGARKGGTGGQRAPPP